MKHLIMACVLLATPGTAFARCRTQVQIPPITVASVDRITADVRTIHDFWSNGPYSPEQNIAERNKRIMLLFENFKAVRLSDFKRYRVRCRSETKVHSRTGEAENKRTTLRFPPGTEIIRSSYRKFGSGHRITPRIFARSIEYEIGKAGRGSNKGGVSALALYTDAKRKALLHADMRPIRAKLAASNLPDDTVQ